MPLESNLSSPFSIAKKLIDKGDIIEATKLFAKNGSLLERNLIFLLSRAKKEDVYKILSFVKDKNPIVLIQLLQGIILDDYSKPRVFKFYKNNTMKYHIEKICGSQNIKIIPMRALTSYYALEKGVIVCF